jgi:glycosyltransferase involved in cell wall biosynthesis
MVGTGRTTLTDVGGESSRNVFVKIVVCWAGMQGYVAACLRALNRMPGVELHVLHLDFQDLPYQEELLHEVSNRRFMAADVNEEIPELVAQQRPDAVLICGWFYAPYRRLIDHPALRSTRFVLGMDTPWTGSWRQLVSLVRLQGFVKRMDRVVVAGAASAEYARRLGVPNDAIVHGFYGFDFTRFREEGGRRLDAAPEWPRRFLFAGRYARVKGIDVLIDAYRRYRSSVSEPWPLHCCGTGPEAPLLREDGVVDLGYVQPSGLPELFARHGVFVMPSRGEPWGVAIAEAAATGLPLICTDVCGAATDLLRPYYNGITVPAADPSALADAMKWMDEHTDQLRAFGLRGRDLAQSFSAEAWATRTHACLTSAAGSVA